MNAALRKPNVDWQFSIGSIMCTTGTFAVLLTYLKTFPVSDFLLGVQIVVAVALAGAVAGCFSKRILETSLWAALGAMTAYLCAVGEPLAHRSFSYGWAIVGATTAVSAIWLETYSLWRRMLVGACLAFAILAIFSTVAWLRGSINTWPEVACGPLAGAIMVGVVWMLEMIRTWKGYSQATMIFTLTLGVVSGNVFARWIGLL